MMPQLCVVATPRDISCEEEETEAPPASMYSYVEYV